MKRQSFLKPLWSTGTVNTFDSSVSPKQQKYLQKIGLRREECLLTGYLKWVLVLVGRDGGFRSSHPLRHLVVTRSVLSLIGNKRLLFSKKRLFEYDSDDEDENVKESVRGWVAKIKNRTSTGHGADRDWHRWVYEDVSLQYHWPNRSIELGMFPIEIYLLTVCLPSGRWNRKTCSTFLTGDIHLWCHGILQLLSQDPALVSFEHPHPFDGAEFPLTISLAT